jgi:precorrin-6A/cobalt-precorrin-6A reductase
MILLLGGTTETQTLALGLAHAGYRVLVSTATTIPFHAGDHPAITMRSGRLDMQGMISLIRDTGINLIIDAVHPYASQARSIARSSADTAGIPCLTYLRPGNTVKYEDIDYTATHGEAAFQAFSFQKPVLLTIGVKNLAPYVAHAGGIPLFVRVLPVYESMETCRSEGIPGDRIIASRGPFTVKDNRSLIQRFSIGVLVTKDSGIEGGVPQKIEAARLEGCHIIMVKRPLFPVPGAADKVYDSINDLISSVDGFLNPE